MFTIAEQKARTTEVRAFAVCPAMGQALRRRAVATRPNRPKPSKATFVGSATLVPTSRPILRTIASSAEHIDEQLELNIHGSLRIDKLSAPSVTEASAAKAGLNVGDSWRGEGCTTAGKRNRRCSRDA